MNEVLVTYLQLPYGVNGLVTPTSEGDYRVVLNSRLSAEQQRETYEHELRHILENHFSRDAEAVQSLEAAACENDALQSMIEKVYAQGSFPVRLPLPDKTNAQATAGAAPQPSPPAPSAEPAAPPICLAGAAIQPSPPVPSAEPAVPPICLAGAATQPSSPAPGTEPAVPPICLAEAAAPAPPPRPKPAKTSLQTALLRAQRAQITGLRY